MTLSAEQRRALEMLADAEESGRTLDMLVTRRRLALPAGQLGLGILDSYWTQTRQHNQNN
jgi:hypothetical protein